MQNKETQDMQGIPSGATQGPRTHWILTAYSEDHSIPAIICHTYAHTEDEVRHNSKAWIDKHSSLGHLEIKAYPGGYVLGGETFLPGREQPEVQP